MATQVPVTRKKHVFDVRQEISVRELKMKRTTQPVECLRCKKLVTDPSASCHSQK